LVTPPRANMSPRTPGRDDQFPAPFDHIFGISPI